MGNSLASESKLMYYPTDEFETYRLLGLLGHIEVDYTKQQYIKNNIIGVEKYKELEILSLDNNIPTSYVIYDYFLQTKQYDKIKEFFQYRLGFSNSTNESVVISDLWAGEGRWLDSFFSIMNRSSYSNLYIAIANEIESNRYKTIQQNPNIYDSYNLPFEDLSLPKNSVSLMLFNPPYSASNGERNCRRYLRLMLDRKVLYNPDKPNEYHTGYVTFVIRKDDFLDSLDLICQHFDIIKDSIYKTDPEEYAKYKQYIFIGKLKKQSYYLDNIYDSMKFKESYYNIKSIIKSEPEFKLSMYNVYKQINYPVVNYDLLKENHKIINTSKIHTSKNDSIWSWVKDITEIKDLSQEKLNIPKMFKMGELANIIASGYINGEMDIEGKGKHIVIGGTKNIQKQEVNSYKDDDGKKVTETKVIKMSQPYLNILCSQNGKLKILELGESE